MSPGYTTHFLVGFLCSVPFYRLDRKDRIKTLFAGAIAGVLPDIDGIFHFIGKPEDPTLQFFFSHRGFWHSLLLPFLFAFLALIYLGIIFFLISSETATDHFWTSSAIAVGWLSHLVLDFGFTPYPFYTSPVWFFPLSDIVVYALDQVSALLITVLVTWTLWNYYFPLFYLNMTQQRQRLRTFASSDELTVQKEIRDFIGTKGYEPLSWKIIKQILREEKVAFITILIFCIIGASLTLYIATK